MKRERPDWLMTPRTPRGVRPGGPWRLTILALTLLAAGNGHARQVQPRTPDSIARSLQNGSDEQRKAIAGELHLVVPPEWREGTPPELLCAEKSTAKVSYVQLLSPGPKQAVLEVNAPICQTAFLVVLSEAGKSGWTHVATMPLSADRGFVPQIEFQELVERGTYEIVVRHLLTDYGTGIFQRNFRILKLFDCGLRSVMDAVEEMRFSIPIGPKGQEENSDQGETSEFTVVASEPRASALKQILRKQTIHRQKVKIERAWNFVWDATIKAFTASPTAISGERYRGRP